MAYITESRNLQRQVRQIWQEVLSVGEFPAGDSLLRSNQYCKLYVLYYF